MKLGMFSFNSMKYFFKGSSSYMLNYSMVSLMKLAMFSINSTKYFFM